MKIDWRRRAWLIGWLVLTVMVAARPALAITEKAAIKQFKTAAKTRLGLLKSALDAVRLTVIARGDACLTSRPRPAGLRSSGSKTSSMTSPTSRPRSRMRCSTSPSTRPPTAKRRSWHSRMADRPSPSPWRSPTRPAGSLGKCATPSSKLLAKTYRSVNKRLAKTSAAIARAGGRDALRRADAPAAAVVRILGRTPRRDPLRPRPRPHRERQYYLTRTRPASGSGDDGLVSGQNLTVSAIPMIANAPGEDQQVTSGGRGRFLARLGDTVPLPRSNYLVGVTPGLGASASSSFAIR